MRKVNSKLKMSRVCLMYLFFLCGVFMSENAHSRRHWVKSCVVVSYSQKDVSIDIKFIIYNYKFEIPDVHGFMESCDFYYSKYKNNYIHLMRIETKKQKEKKWTSLKMSKKKPKARIQLLNCFIPENGEMWPDDAKELDVEVRVTDEKYLVGREYIKTKSSYMSVKWFFPHSSKRIQSIRIMGNWKVSGEFKCDVIDQVYEVKYTSSNSNTMKSTPSELKSEISINVKVIGETDALTVTGVELGEEIKVYTISGVEVKSVVANEDVVNFKLPKNQIYIVKAGQACYKVALCVP